MSFTNIKMNRDSINQWRRQTGRLMRGHALSSGGGKAFKPVSAQALLEFGLISIPMLMTIIGIFEFALAYWDNLNLEVMNREVSRRIAINPTLDNTRCGFPSTEQFVFAVMYPDLSGTCVNSNPVQNTFKPWQVNYILIQRMSITGSIDVVPTTTYKTKYVNKQNQIHDTFSYDRLYDKSGGAYVGGGPGQNIGYQPFYLVYVYKPGASDVVSGTGFRLALTESDTALSADQKRWANPRGWTGTDLNKQPLGGNGWPWNQKDILPTPSDYVYTPGGNPQTFQMAGRRTCEPTDYYYIEMSYRHAWATPILQAIGGDSVSLLNRIKGKIEPKFYERPKGESTPCLDEQSKTFSQVEDVRTGYKSEDFTGQMSLAWWRNDD